MVVAFSPVTASKHIKEKYYRYLKTTFKMGEPYKKEYEALLENQDAFAKGPYAHFPDDPQDVFSHSPTPLNAVIAAENWEEWIERAAEELRGFENGL